MLILSIESSCDETSIALLACNQTKKELESLDFLQIVNQSKVLGSVISSQIALHAKYGGVIPELGAREHAQNIHHVLNQCLAGALSNPLLNDFIKENISDAGSNLFLLFKHIDFIAVTVQPGLVSALRVGREMARSLKFFADFEYKKKIEIIEVNHLHGHVASCFFAGENLQINPEKKAQTDIQTTKLSDDQLFPHLHLLVSGGNSQIIYMKSWLDWQIVGKTLDDAAGECFDKCGRMLGIAYPAGATVSKIAKFSEENYLNLPISMQKSSSLDMSFSGLKTAVRYNILSQNIPDFEFEKPLKKEEIDQLLAHSFLPENKKLTYIYQACCSLQFAIISQLKNQFVKGVKAYSPLSLGISGGVSANPMLRLTIQKVAQKFSQDNQSFQTKQKMQITQNQLSNKIFIPHPSLSGDNAVMIALAGLLNYANFSKNPSNPQ